MDRIALQKNSLSRIVDGKSADNTAGQTFIDNRSENRKVAELKQVMQNSIVQRKVIQMVKTIMNITTGVKQTIDDAADTPKGWIELTPDSSLVDAYRPLVSEVKKEHLRRASTRGVQIGKAHRAGSTKKGKSISTPKVEKRAIKYISLALSGKDSKAKVMGQLGSDILWELERSTKSRQAAKGSRLLRQHIGGGKDTDPLDMFEAGTGNMSDTDESDAMEGSEV